VHKITNTIAPLIPEEQRTATPKVSEAAGAYFSALRERQAQLRATADRPKYEKLGEQEQV